MSERAGNNTSSRRTRRADRGYSTTPTPDTQSVQRKGDRIKEDAESLVDEIDEVLEENAETIIKNFRQRGGE